MCLHPRARVLVPVSSFPHHGSPQRPSRTAVRRLPSLGFKAPQDASLPSLGFKAP